MSIDVKSAYLSSQENRLDRTIESERYLYIIFYIIIIALIIEYIIRGDTAQGDGLRDLMLQY